MTTMMQATGLDLDVALDKEQDGTYKVTYGQYVSIEDTFEEALAEFNSCVLHSATCAGLMD